MVTKKRSAPPTRRTFRSPWFELDYLCEKVSYWLYERKEKARANRYLGRLERVLKKLPENDLAIIRQEGWALAKELKGDLDDAIRHRTKEIELIERLHREADLPRYDKATRAYMLSKRDVAALQNRRQLLDSLIVQNRERNGMSSKSA